MEVSWPALGCNVLHRGDQAFESPSVVKEPNSSNNHQALPAAL